MMIFPKLLFVLAVSKTAFITTKTTIVEAFPISSSSSSSNKAKKGFGGKGVGGSSGGFGKRNDQVPTTHTVDESPTTTNLIKFLLSQQSKGIGPNSNTEVGIEGIRRGLYASKPIKKGEIICQIPSDCCLALSDPALGGSDSPTLAHNGRNFIEFYIRNAQNNMMWSPYLDTLPTQDSLSSSSVTPDFYSQEEIQQLEFPRAIKYAQQRVQDIKDVSEKYGYDYDELQYATWISSTRSFPIQLSSDEPVPEGDAVAKPSKTIRVLAPYIDLANHSSNNANVELHLIDPEKDEAWFALRATRPIKQGKELLRCFGNGVESSVELLCNHGFVPDENKIDAFMLKKGGDDAIESLTGWSTTLEEDEALSAAAEGNMKNVFKLRMQLKRSYE
mmetsp:Transcript_1378/g.2230  ORF Transcript_1378/g.2230 Transcript_1378/m.2230 type:complete len:388 (-) Transcript_1378:2129-3292(-)